MNQLTFNLPQTWQPLDLPMADVRLWRQWLPEERAAVLMARFIETLDWQQPSLTIAGKTHKIPRLKAWHGDVEAHYRYSGRSFSPSPWTEELWALKSRLEQTCSAHFNSVLANWYRSGDDGMGFHADNEKELGEEPTIASISLGAARRFVLKPIKELDGTGIKGIDLDLSDGDLLLMRGATQRYWRHGVPKTRKSVGPRVNLTFRYIYQR